MKGLLIDYGGVLTTDVFASFTAFCSAEGLAPDRVRELFRTDASARSLLAGLEDGTLSEDAFEESFAGLLGVAPAGLIRRLLGGAGPDHAMLAAVRSARHAGVRTGLISNSWGVRGYDRELLTDLFDAVVISGEEGVRKPAPAIYELGVLRLGVPAGDCVYVDDLPGNLKPAAALGMATVRHRDAPTTIAELERLLGVPLGTGP